MGFNKWGSIWQSLKELVMRINIYKKIIKIHFVILFVALYTGIRLGNGFVKINDLQESFIKFLLIGAGIWFVFSNLYLLTKKFKTTWGPKDYLSPYVLVSVVVIVILLEYLVF